MPSNKSKATTIRLFEGKDIVTKVIRKCKKLQEKGYYICGFRLGLNAITTLIANHSLNNITEDLFKKITESKNGIPPDTQLGSWLGCPYSFASELKPDEIEIIYAKVLNWAKLEIDEKWVI